MTPTILRTRRRSLTLEITDDGELLVRAPLKLSARHIQKFIQEKHAWIIRTSQKVRAHRRTKHHYHEGETFYFLGKEYPLHLIHTQSRSLGFDDAFYLPRSQQAHGKVLFKKWYSTQAKAVLPERLAKCAARYRLKFKNVKITSAMRRWGSCNVQGNINFSWRLVMAPLTVIDYVIAHELSHLTHRNHSKSFWAAVAHMHPHLSSDKRWLKAHEPLLKL